MANLLNGALNSDYSGYNPVVDLSSFNFDAAALDRTRRSFDLAMSRGMAADAQLYHQSGQNGDVVNAINSMSDKLDTLNKDIANMKIVLDSGVMAGHLARGIDRQMGSMIDSAKRRNAV